MFIIRMPRSAHPRRMSSVRSRSPEPTGSNWVMVNSVGILRCATRADFGRIIHTPMRTPGETRPLATLWNLAWHEDRLVCVVYRTAAGMELCVESPDAIVVSERFDLQPRALARAQALRAALKR